MADPLAHPYRLLRPSIKYTANFLQLIAHFGFSWSGVHSAAKDFRGLECLLLLVKQMLGVEDYCHLVQRSFCPPSARLRSWKSVNNRIGDAWHGKAYLFFLQVPSSEMS